jgi:hypothetical protein
VAEQDHSNVCDGMAWGELVNRLGVGVHENANLMRAVHFHMTNCGTPLTSR